MGIQLGRSKRSITCVTSSYQPLEPWTGVGGRAILAHGLFQTGTECGGATGEGRPAARKTVGDAAHEEHAPKQATSGECLDCLNYLAVAPRQAHSTCMRKPKTPAWKRKPELCATCKPCKEVFPLGYNFCPDCGKGLTRRRIIQAAS